MNILYGRLGDVNEERDDVEFDISLMKIRSWKVR